MTSEKIIEIWKRRATQGDEIAVKCLKNRGISFIQQGGEPYSIPRAPPDFSRLRESKSGDRIKHFRPTPEVLLILLDEKIIPPRKMSKFINRAILFYYKESYLKYD